MNTQDSPYRQNEFVNASCNVQDRQKLIRRSEIDYVSYSVGVLINSLLNKYLTSIGTFTSMLCLDVIIQQTFTLKTSITSGTFVSFII